MKQIIISNANAFTVCDDEDFPLLSSRSWSLNGCGYCQASYGGRVYTMHRLVMNAQPGQEIDHIDGDKLNNRKDNLRFVTRSENMRNVTDRKSGQVRNRKHGKYSQYLGVTRNKRGYWVAQCRNRDKYIYRYFHDEISAAKGYDEISREIYGPDAVVNFP
jgi:hypothetical protein